jgi:hypothetical protein
MNVAVALVLTIWVVAMWWLVRGFGATGAEVPDAGAVTPGRIAGDGLASKPASHAGRRRMTIDAQVLFVEIQGHDVQIDCIMLAPLEVGGRHLPSGCPLTLRAHRPEGGDLDGTVLRLLRNWAVTGASVRLEFVDVDGHLRVDVRGNASMLRLELEEAFA